MYETHYPTDWDRLDPSEAIERAHALGVAAACDRPDRAEFRRLLGELDAPDRGVAVFVFREGRREARTRLSAGDSPDDVWAGLVGRQDQKETVADNATGENVGVADGGRDEFVPQATHAAEFAGFPGALTRGGRLEQDARQAVPGFLRGR